MNYRGCRVTKNGARPKCRCEIRLPDGELMWTDKKNTYPEAEADARKRIDQWHADMLVNHVFFRMRLIA